MSSGDVKFRQRNARWIAAGALLSLLASFYLLLTPSELSRVDSVGADGYSRSAIGHSGLLRLLRELGEPVLQLRRLRELGECGLFVVAEPGEVDAAGLAALADAVEQAPVSLLVLPKRAGHRDPRVPRWIREEQLLEPDEVTDVLRRLLDEGDAAAPGVTRVASVGAFRRHGLPAGPDPELRDPMQLFTPGQDLEPMLECDEGVLLGRVGDLYVLSDPDLLANHGLHRGDNAAVAVGIVQAIKGAGAIVFDETSHGHRLEPSIWTEAGRFPLVLVPVHLLLLLAVVLWAAAGRFGSPLPAPAAIEAGKRFLIENIVALLQRGGRHAPSLRRYQRQRVRRAAERLHAPRGLGDDACRDWVLTRSPSAGQRAELAELLQRSPEDMGPGEVLRVAQRVHEITEEKEKMHVVS